MIESFILQISVLQLESYPSRLIRKAIRHINPRCTVLQDAYRFILQEEVSSCQHVASWQLNFNSIFISDSDSECNSATSTRERQHY